MKGHRDAMKGMAFPRAFPERGTLLQRAETHSNLTLRGRAQAKMHAHRARMLESDAGMCGWVAGCGADPTPADRGSVGLVSVG